MTPIQFIPDVSGRLCLVLWLEANENHDNAVDVRCATIRHEVEGEDKVDAVVTIAVSHFAEARMTSDRNMGNATEPATTFSVALRL